MMRCEPCSSAPTACIDRATLTGAAGRDRTPSAVARWRSARWHRRAGDVPQCRERLRRAAGEGARLPRPGHHCRPRRSHRRRRVDHRHRGVGQRPHPRPAVQGALPEDLGADHGGGDRALSRLRHDPRHRPGLCEEAGAGLRRAGVRHYRRGAAAPARARPHSN